MPDIKEKLVELLEPNMGGFTCGDESGSCEFHNCRTCNAINLADHLIANGVTIQEWIPVEERLPGKDENGMNESVLVCVDGDCVGEAYMSEYSESGWTWVGEDGIDVEGIVTHWMPLPEPPKAEEVHHE